MNSKIQAVITLSNNTRVIRLGLILSENTRTWLVFSDFEDFEILGGPRAKNFFESDKKANQKFLISKFIFTSRFAEKASKHQKVYIKKLH